MDALLQRLKELDQVTFQQLCFQVMSAKYPSARIHYVEGVAGDEGLDLFAGELSAGPAVWQCKAFQVTIIGDSQKNQIRKSLRDAVKNVSPKRWTLCLNMNFDAKGHRWFQGRKRSYAAEGVAVELIEGTDIARELLFRKTLRNYYFPGAALDPAEIRALFTGTHALDDTALEKLTTENAEQWLERLTEKDARFAYEVTFGGDRGPKAFPPLPEPGLVAALTDGGKVIKMFARDVDALRLDPVGAQLHMSEEGAKKVLDLIRTGKDQHWTPEEIRGFTTTLPILSGIKFQAGALTIETRSLPDNKVVPLRPTLTSGASTMTIRYVEFRKMRAGTHEVELATVGEEPLGLRFVLPFDGSSPAQVTISKHLVGKEVKAAAQAANALRMLQNGCEIEIFSLKLNSPLGVLQGEPIDVGLPPGFFSFIEDLAKIAERFNARLTLPDPETFTEDDEKAFLMLRAFATNGTMQLGNVTVTVVKSDENAQLFPEQLAELTVFRVEYADYRATLFGTELHSGPCAIQVDQAEVKNFAQTIAQFRKAAIGEAVTLSLRPVAPVKYLLLGNR
jgi:hypothetical protein